MSAKGHGGRGTPMPELYDRIHKHLLAHFTDQVAWAVTVNAVRRGCLTGDVNFPGIQHMTPIHKTEFCAAYEEWKKSHPKAAIK